MSSKAASTATDSSSESENEKVYKSSTARRNYLRAHANNNMRAAGIYNGAMLNQYHQQHQLQQQQHLYRQQQLMHQGYDNYAYTNCSYMPNYYGQYVTQSNCSYPQQYLATPNKIPTEYLSLRYVVPAPVEPQPRYVPHVQYSYYQNNDPAPVPVQAITSGYNYTTYVENGNQQIVYQRASTATTLNCDYNSKRNSMILNDVPTYEMTHNPPLQQQQQQQQALNEQMKRVASENSLRFINIAAVGGSANMLGSNQSLNKSNGEYGPKKVDLDRSNDLKGQINFLNFDKYQKRSKCKPKVALLVCLAVTIAVIVVLAAVLGSVLPSSDSKSNQKAKTMGNSILIAPNSTINSTLRVKQEPAILNTQLTNITSNKNNTTITTPLITQSTRTENMTKTTLATATTATTTPKTTTSTSIVLANTSAKARSIDIIDSNTRIKEELVSSTSTRSSTAKLTTTASTVTAIKQSTDTSSTKAIKPEISSSKSTSSTPISPTTQQSTSSNIGTTRFSKKVNLRAFINSF